MTDTFSRPSTNQDAAQPRPKSILLTDVVHDRIRRAVLNGDYSVDEKLPGENVLAQLHNVSRPVVRTALQRLRQEGLIVSRQGAGSFVRAPITPKPLAFQPLETIADLQRCYEFRLTIEPAAAALAAARRNEHDLADIAKCLQIMRDATARRNHREDADFDFHLAITTAANNPYYQTSMLALREHIAVGMKFHGLSLQTVRDGLDHVLDEHASIYDAIARGASDEARAAMLSHITGSRDRLFEGRLLDLSDRASQPQSA